MSGDAQDDQPAAFVSVVFDGGAAAVTFRNVLEEVPGDAGATEFSLLGVFLCSGPNDCEELSGDFCDGAEGEDGVLSPGEEVTCQVTAAEAGGELALMSADASVDGVFAFAYMAWGAGFDSVPPAAGGQGALSLEEHAVGQGLWTLEDRIDAPAGNENAIFSTGFTDTAGGFTTCTE